MQFDVGANEWKAIALEQGVQREIVVQVVPDYNRPENLYADLAGYRQPPFRFGAFVLAAGAAGEFAPIMVVSLVLTRKFGAWQEIAWMLAFVAVGVGPALIALGLRPPRVLKLLERTMHSSTQLPPCRRVWKDDRHQRVWW